MSQNEFGKCLKKMRQKHGKTQEEVANSIKKTKMLICGMENGKNSPPQKMSELEKMVQCMELTEEEGFELKCKASFARGTLPDNLISLIKQDERYLNLLYGLKEKKMMDKNYEKIMSIIRNGE